MICLSTSLLHFPLAAQTPSPQSPSADEPYLIPQTIFVGDSGRLVVPLAETFAGAEPFVRASPEELPDATPDIAIKRIELERRGGTARLLIDFVPFAPGILSLPPLGLPSAENIIAPNGLKVNIASILSPSDMALSQPASAMAVPGTSLLIYGIIIPVIVVLFLGIGGGLWGRRYFRDLWERLRRRRLLRAMAKFLRRIRKQNETDSSADPAYYLSLLSAEFREFLSLFTGFNCRPLSAGEFMDFEGALYPDAVHGPAFLCGLFRNWDTLRFSGRGIGTEDLFLSLKETEGFIAALDRAEREKPSLKPRDSEESSV